MLYYHAAQLVVEVAYSLQLFRIAGTAIGKCHRLHMLFLEHEPQVALVAHGQNLLHVVGIILDIPSQM